MLLNLAKYKIYHIDNEIKSTSTYLKHNFIQKNKYQKKKLNIKCQSISNEEKNSDKTTNTINEDENNTKTELLCLGTGNEVECIIPESDAGENTSFKKSYKEKSLKIQNIEDIINIGILISPFFFWGTGMVVMKVIQIQNISH